MLEAVARCEALCGVLGEEFADEVLGLGGNFGETRVIEVNIGVANLVLQVRLIKRV